MAPAARMKMGAKVWVKDVDVHNPDVFVMATLKGVKGRMCEVETEKGDAFDTDTYFPANPPNQDQNDHTALLHLSDATLLANTKMRYAKDEIYTFVGPILVSVNPFKYIAKLYEPELMATCKKFQPGHPERPAHTFSMAEAAYQQMKKEKRHQSLVVSGESGAGKTEVNKQCMNYLVWRASGADGAHGSLSTRILQSNPILEGLGNAKTVRNNNSSRFGKYVTMRFDERNMLQGAEVQTFLLEKSRVVATTAKGERNYHVFYHVLLGSGLLPEADPMKLRLLSRSGTTTVPSSELQAFRIKTSRIEYHLKPQDEVGGNAEDWVEEITEVMLAAEEGDDDDADRDYGAFMGDYNEVVPANEASRRPP